ncbi:GspE/PulE family protein [Pontiella agarivorans]|uniref:GspE/PulE family protein n=1 Tax=Pontiella agarivorans TaxID=3038953 RepID=A0ABU5MXZ7_9BACT|nr:GspE/PulE family protein [Pontiella agarivorans]MDZ8119040.1 GspE/PulE family protein [Pontiella agarivorans]
MRNNHYIAEILGNRFSRKTIETALQQCGPETGDLLDQLADENCSRHMLFSDVARHVGMEQIELDETVPASSAANLIDPEIALRYRTVPIRKTGTALTLAFGDPSDIETLDTLRYLFDTPVEIVAALPEQIEATLKRLYSEPTTPIPEKKEEPPVQSDDEPVIRLVNLLITEGFNQRASDIHLEPLSATFRVRYRIDGALREVEGPPRRLHPSVISRIKIMAGMKISEKRLPQDGRIEINAEGRPLDLRVSSIPTNHGESIVMRILDKQTLQLGLPNLGFHEEDHKTFQRLIQYPDGILLVTGPTGSGKTTSLYACLNHLNQPDRKIITVEDPVEYQLNGINQVRVRSDIGLTFSAALRSMLRQAPNIIMIGEIRDRETAEIAVNAALTGHLVLSTLHTNDAPSAVTRLTDIGIKPFLISSAVRGIMAQRLVRTICGSCKVSYAPSATEQQLAEPVSSLWKGEGCPACGHTGYHGRKGIFELMAINDALRELIYRKASTAELRNAAAAGGMRTLREDGLRKAADGETTLSEVLRVTMGDRNG